MEALSAIAEAAVETAKEIGETAVAETENSFPEFFDSIGEKDKCEGLENRIITKQGRVFPSFFDEAIRGQETSENDGFDKSKQYEANSTIEVDGRNYKTDDNGNIFKTDGELNPNSKYEINGISYETDSEGRISNWDGEPGYNPEAERDGEAQTDAGGDDRKPGDDGGHLVARVLNGSSGNENIVAMRDTINRGDYKKAENEIANAKKLPAEKEVHDSGKILYDGDSKRPSKIERTYTIDGVTKELTVDNVEGSKDLLDSIENDISESDFQNIEDRIADMEEDGAEVSVTSVLKEYDENSEVASITVGIRDEISKTKTYIKFEVR